MSKDRFARVVFEGDVFEEKAVPDPHELTRLAIQKAAPVCNCRCISCGEGRHSGCDYYGCLAPNQ